MTADECRSKIITVSVSYEVTVGGTGGILRYFCGGSDTEGDADILKTNGKGTFSKNRPTDDGIAVLCTDIHTDGTE